MCGEHDDFFFMQAGQLSDHVAGGIDLNMQTRSGQERFDRCRALAFLKGWRGDFRQARLLVIDPLEIGCEPCQRRADLRVFGKLSCGSGARGVSGEGRANRHSEKDNPNEDAFHCPAPRCCDDQCRAAPAQRAEISASVKTRADCLAASKIRLTRESSAGILWLSSQKRTLDLPLMGPISITCSRPKRCEGTPL